MKFFVGSTVSFLAGFGVALFVSPYFDTDIADVQKTHLEQSDVTHMHAMRKTDPSLPIPAVTLEVTPDAKDGYNVHIVTENYAFTPESVNSDVVVNTGHAHLYVNGAKIARLYSEWFHIPATLLQEGDNTVVVTLNANDHSEWTNGDSHIMSRVTISR